MYVCIFVLLSRGPKKVCLIRVDCLDCYECVFVVDDVVVKIKICGWVNYENYLYIFDAIVLMVFLLLEVK